MNVKKIIVTGCGGQLGRSVNALLGGDDRYQLYNTDVMESPSVHALDITDIEQVLALTEAEKPYAIINCAAYTAVDAQESDVDTSFRINALGPRNLAIASSRYGAKLVHISTDYVFSGVSDHPYTEFDAVGPVSVYGRTKLAGEKFVEQFAREYFIIRTAWLYGDGKNFVRTMLRLSETRDEVSVVSDQVGTPTSSDELARAAAYLMETDNYGLFHGTCEGSTNWADFAKEIFSLAGRQTRVRSVTSDEYQSMNPQSARRPAFSILDNYMLRLTGDFKFSDWHDAIEAYMAKEKYGKE